MRKSLLSLLGILLCLTAYAAPAETVLWEGEVSLDYKINPEIKASQCADFEEWGEVVIYYQADPKVSDYNALALIRPSWANFSWGGADAVVISAGKKSFFLTADDVKYAISGGMGVMGHGLIVTKVVYRASQGPLDPSILQRDEIVINQEQSSLEFTYDNIVAAGGKVGGGIAVSYSVLNPMAYKVNFKHQGVAPGGEYDEESAPYVWAEFTSPRIIEDDENGRMILLLSEKTMAELNSYSKRLILEVGFVKISKVQVLTAAQLPEVPDLAVVAFDKENITLEVGDTDKITATIKPATAVAKWTTSDPAVATVDNEGNVTAVGGGKATITCEIEGAKATCEVSVVMIKVQWLENISGQPIYGDEENITAYIGMVPRLIITTIPENTKIKFSAVQDPDKIADVYEYTSSTYGSPQAEFSLKKEGTINITLQLNGYDLEKKISLKSIDYPEAMLYLERSYSGNPMYNNILAGTEFKITAKLGLPAGSSKTPYKYQEYTWSVSDPTIAEIKSQSDYSTSSLGTIVGLKTGTVTVTASVTSEDGTSTITGSTELTFTGHGEFSHEFYFQNDRGGSWIGKYGISNVPGNDVINDITLHGSGVDMILNSATTVSYIPKFTAGQSFTFKVSDPNVRIMGISASPVSSATALVTFGDKTTCTTGTNDKTSWSADDEYGVEEVTFTVLEDKEVAGLIYWTPKMYRYATPELVLSDTELDGTAGESKQLSLDVANKDTEKVLPATTVWTSADPAIAKVDADGLVTYVSKGSTEITADYNGTKAVCKVNVLGQTAIESIGTDAANAPAEYFNLQGIRVDASALTPGVYIVRKGNEVNKVVIK